MKTFAFALILVLGLAGCTMPGSPTTPTTQTTITTPTVVTEPATTTTSTMPTTTTPDVPTGALGNDTFVVATTGIPTTVKAGAKFNFTVYVNGSRTVDTDHIGAHYGTNTTTAPTPTAYPGACVHITNTTALPGTFVIECTLPAEGTYYLRGHARVTTTDATLHYWGPEIMIKSIDFTLKATNVPATAVSGQPVSFTLNITGNATLTSDHIGAHYGNTSSVDASTTIYPEACQHQNGAVPGVYTVVCTIMNKELTPQKAYLRGHLRITSGDDVFHFWTPDQFELTVSPSVI